MKRQLIAAFFLITAFAVAAQGAQPMEALRGPLDEIISILRDPQYKEASRKEVQRREIWKVTRRVFDFRKIGELALGRYRRGFDEKQMDEFTEAFSELLANTYLSKIQGEYQNEQVRYLNERVKGDKAIVETQIVRESIQIPVDYGMWLNNDLWRIFDVRVEGVSLVKNYRTQFQSILENNPPDHLIAQLKEKVEKQKKGEE